MNTDLDELRQVHVQVFIGQLTQYKLHRSEQVLTPSIPLPYAPQR